MNIILVVLELCERGLWSPIKIGEHFAASEALRQGIETREMYLYLCKYSTYRQSKDIFEQQGYARSAPHRNSSTQHSSEYVHIPLYLLTAAVLITPPASLSLSQILLGRTADNVLLLEYAFILTAKRVAVEI